MKTAEEQIVKIQNDIEGILNDFESGISDKDESIVLLREYVYERADVAVKNYSQRINGTINQGKGAKMTLRSFIEKKMKEKADFDARLGLTLTIEDAVDVTYGIMRDMGIRDDDFEIEIEDETKTD